MTPYVGTIGNVGLHNKDGIYHLGSNVGKIELLNPTSVTLVTEEYIHLFLTSQTGYDELSKHKKATAQESISIEAIRDVYVPIPPVKIQECIVTRFTSIAPLLSEYAEYKGKLDSLNKSIFESIKKSILQEAIQGRLVPHIESEGTADELLEEINVEKKRLVKEGKLKKSVLTNESRIFRGDDNKYYEQIGSKILDISEEAPFDLPDSWRFCRLGDIAYLRLGKTPPRSESKYWNPATFPWVSIADMKDGETIYCTKEAISKKGAALFQNVMSPAGSLIMSFKLTIGKISILGMDAFHNEAIVTIRPYSLSIDWFRYFLPMIAQTGTTKDAIKGKTLNNKSLNELLIPLPPLQEQQRIIARIEEISHHL